MAQRRSVGRYATLCRIEPGTGGVKAALRQPHQAVLKVELGDRKRRDPLVTPPTLCEHALGLGDLPSFRLEHGQRAQRREIGPGLRGKVAEYEGFVVASERLEDRGTLGIQCRPIQAESLRCVEIGQRLGEAMEGRSRPGAGQAGQAIGGGVTHKLLGQRYGALGVGNATQDVPA
jgi:hypothetical protein